MICSQGIQLWRSRSSWRIRSNSTISLPPKTWKSLQMYLKNPLKTDHGLKLHFSVNQSEIFNFKKLNKLKWNKIFTFLHKNLILSVSYKLKLIKFSLILFVSVYHDKIIIIKLFVDNNMLLCTSSWRTEERLKYSWNVPQTMKKQSTISLLRDNNSVRKSTVSFDFNHCRHWDF